MKKTISTFAALAMVASGALYAGSVAATAGPESKTAAKPKATKFAFKASGFGSRATGGDVPAESDTTAFQAFGCSNKAGIDKENYVASADLGGAGEAQEVTTRLWTTSQGGITATNSRSHIERIVLSEDSFGLLEISAVNSLARAFHDDKGFHAETTTTLGAITLTPPVGPPQEIPIPSPGQEVPIPGVGTLALGAGSEKATADYAMAIADGIRIDLEPTGSVVKIAHTRAKLEKGVKSGLMRGHSVGASAKALADNLKLGQTPLSLMPCAGTDGRERAKSIASSDLGGGLLLRGLTTRQQGTQTFAKATGFERGRVGLFELGGGELVVDNIIGKVSVTRVGGKLERSIDGTKVGTVTIQGDEQEFPDTDVLEIPGVAKLERSVVERSPHGIHVIALRVTLLDGTGAVLNLGEAKLSISPATDPR